MTECWINNTRDVVIDNFIYKAIPLSRKRYQQLRSWSICHDKQNREKIDIMYETFGWLRESKELAGGGNNHLVAYIYIPPKNSSFYKIHDVDLFY